MIVLIQGVIAFLVLVLCVVIARDVYNAKEGVQVNTKRLGILIGYILVLLASSITIIKFL